MFLSISVLCALCSFVWYLSAPPLHVIYACAYILFLLLDDELWGQVESVNLCYSAQQDWCLRITHDHTSKPLKKETDHSLCSFFYYSLVTTKWSTAISTPNLLGSESQQLYHSYLISILRSQILLGRESKEYLPSIYSEIHLGFRIREALDSSFGLFLSHNVSCCSNCKPG